MLGLNDIDMMPETKTCPVILQVKFGFFLPRSLVGRTNTENGNMNIKIVVKSLNGFSGGYFKLGAEGSAPQFFEGRASFSGR